MARYFYDRYYRKTVHRRATEDYMGQETSWYGGYPNYSIVNGSFQTSGAYRQVNAPYTNADWMLGELYQIVGGKLHGNRPYQGSSTEVFTNIYIVVADYERGSYVDTISAPDGTYPSDGYQGSYWYVKQTLADTATLTNPSSVDTNYTLSWSKTSSDVNVDIELFNGSTWKRIASNRTGGNLVYDFTNEPETSTARLRIRAVYGGEVGTWNTTSAFTIRHYNLDETAEIILPSGGESISGEFAITWGKSNDDNTVDIELSTNNGQSWKSILSNGSGTSYTHDFLSEIETSTARLRIRAVSGYQRGDWKINDGVFTIQHDYAPSQPSNLSPNNTIISRLDVIPLIWTHNHPNPQSKFDLRWSPNQQSWHTITRSTTGTTYNAPEELFPAGEIYWQVRTYSDAGIVSTWSSVAKFTAAIPSDAPTILSSPTTSIARPTFQWSQADQVAYQIIILDSVNQEVWNTGEVTSSNKAVTSGIDLLNYSTYKFRIRTKTALGLWTQYSEQIITVSYTPPAVPTVSVEMTETGVSFNINNPEPTGTEPFHSHNDLYKVIDDKWIRIAKELQGEYTDHSLASEELAVYRVRAVSTDNDTFSESEVINVTGNKLKGIWIYDVDNPSETIYMFLQSESNAIDVTYDREHGFRQFAGRKQPSIEWGNSEKRIIDAKLALRDEEKEYEKLAYFSMNGSTVLYRDYRGRKMYGAITGIQAHDQFYGNTVAVRITEIDYTEEV